MCGRFFVDAKNREIDRLLAELPADAPPVKTGEIFPTDIALTLTLRDGAIRPEAMAWGFPRWDGKGVIINARAETAPQKPMFAKSLRQRPVVVPACGFYEWKSIEGVKRKQKYLFRSPASPLIYMAAFWNKFSEEHGPVREHFTILTQDGDDFMREWHDRMPLILQSDQIMSWLNGQKREELLNCCPSALEAVKV